MFKDGISPQFREAFVTLHKDLDNQGNSTTGGHNHRQFKGNQAGGWSGPGRGSAGAWVLSAAGVRIRRSWEGVAEKWRPFVGEGVDICHTSTVHSGSIGRTQFLPWQWRTSGKAFHCVFTGCRWRLLDISSGNAGLALRAASRSQRSCDFGRV